MLLMRHIHNHNIMNVSFTKTWPKRRFKRDNIAENFLTCGIWITLYSLIFSPVYAYIMYQYYMVCTMWNCLDYKTIRLYHHMTKISNKLVMNGCLEYLRNTTTFVGKLYYNLLYLLLGQYYPQSAFNNNIGRRNMDGTLHAWCHYNMV